MRSGDRGADEGDLDGGIGLLDDFGHLLVAVPAHGAGEEDEELVVLQDADDVLPAEVVGRSVDQARSLQHSGGIGEPDGIPVGLDLAGGGPAAAGATVKLFKGRRIQEQRLQRHTDLQVYHFAKGFGGFCRSAGRGSGQDREIQLNQKGFAKIRGSRGSRRGRSEFVPLI